MPRTIVRAEPREVWDPVLVSLSRGHPHRGSGYSPQPGAKHKRGLLRRRPMRVEIKAAFIAGGLGIIAAIVGAIIVTNGGSSEQTSPLSVTSVRFSATTVTVTGASHGLSGAVIYAIARPSRKSSGATAPALKAAATPSGARWDVSGPVVPDRHGNWSATIHLPAIPHGPLTVMAVQWIRGVERGGPGQQPKPRTLLAQFGRQATTGRRSRAIRAQPP
jgi:hypothetical protein